MSTEDRIPKETVVAMAPTALFMFALALVSAWLISGWKSDIGGLVFVMMIAWLPTLLIARGALAVHRALMKRTARPAAMFVPWLALLLDSSVAYALAMVLLSH